MVKTKYILFKNPKILKILVSANINSDGRKSFDGRGKFQKYLIYSNQMVKTKYIFLKNPKILKILVLAHVDSDGRKSFDRKGKFQKYLKYSYYVD